MDGLIFHRYNVRLVGCFPFSKAFGFLGWVGWLCVCEGIVFSPLDLGWMGWSRVVFQLMGSGNLMRRNCNFFAFIAFS